MTGSPSRKSAPRAHGRGAFCTILGVLRRPPAAPRPRFSDVKIAATRNVSRQNYENSARAPEPPLTSRIQPSTPSPRSASQPPKPPPHPGRQKIAATQFVSRQKFTHIWGRGGAQGPGTGGGEGAPLRTSARSPAAAGERGRPSRCRRSSAQPRSPRCASAWPCRG